MILKSILETAHAAVFMQNALTVVLEIYVKNLFLNEVMLIGLKFYLQKKNNIKKNTFID